MFLSQTVALAISVAPMDAAVMTVILTAVGEFNQTMDEYPVPVDLLPDKFCCLSKIPSVYGSSVVMRASSLASARVCSAARRSISRLIACPP